MAESSGSQRVPRRESLPATGLVAGSCPGYQIHRVRPLHLKVVPNCGCQRKALQAGAGGYQPLKVTSKSISWVAGWYTHMAGW